MTSSLATSRSQKALAEQARQDRLDERTVISSLMSTPAGRRWVWTFLVQAALFREDTDLDPYRMAFTKGKRNLGMALLEPIERHVPHLRVKMMEESTSYLRVVEQASEEEENPDD
jgi:hypothetical protein